MINFDKKTYKLQIWDGPGGDKFRAVPAYFYRSVNAYLLVFDITSRLSFMQLEHFLSEINQHAINDYSIILIGNKSDLSDIRTVSFDEAHSFATQYNIIYIETSAKIGYGQKELINLIVPIIQNAL